MKIVGPLTQSPLDPYEGVGTITSLVEETDAEVLTHPK